MPSTRVMITLRKVNHGELTRYASRQVKPDHQLTEIHVRKKMINGAGGQRVEIVRPANDQPLTETAAGRGHLVARATVHDTRWHA